MEFAISQSKVIQRIYKIVTGVISDVGVLSTHLVRPGTHLTIHKFN